MKKLTYKTSRADLEGRSSLTHSAVSSRYDGVRIQQRATAEVGAILLQTDDEGEVTLLGGCSANNVFFLRGGSGSCAADGGDRKCDDEVFEQHCDEDLAEGWARCEE